MTMPFTPCDSSDHCTDVSVEILEWIFGPIIERLTREANIEGITAGSNILASMVEFFNSGILFIASFIISYIALVGVVNTANEGEALGKNWGSIWTPVRIFAGGSVLLPTASGFSFIQVIVLMFTLWGVGLANSIYRAGIENHAINGALASVGTHVGLGGDKKVNVNYPLYNVREYAQNYLLISWCSQLVNKYYPSADVKANDVPDEARSGVKVFYYVDRRPEYPLAGGTSAKLCGVINKYDYVSIPINLQQQKTRSASLSDEMVNAHQAAMDKINLAVWRKKDKAIEKLNKAIDEWIKDWPLDVDPQQWAKVDPAQFNAIVAQIQSDLVKSLHESIQDDNELREILAKYVDSMTEDGWVMAGGFYQRLSGIRAEMAKIYRQPTVKAEAPSLTGLPNNNVNTQKIKLLYETVTDKIFTRSAEEPGYLDDSYDLSSLRASLMRQLAGRVNIEQLGVNTKIIVFDRINKLQRNVIHELIGNTGNTDVIARAASAGYQLKSLKTILDEVTDVLNKDISAHLAKKSGGDVQVISKWVNDNVLNSLKKVSEKLELLAFYFSIFLPSLPYAIFIIAVIGWVLTVFQSLLAAPLWAVLHMTPGQTFVGGQRQGYLLLLVLFVRPALIVLGLFIAMVVINPIVFYISQAFWVMYTSSNSPNDILQDVDGFFSWLAMYGFVLLPVIYMVFGLAQTLPDTVLRWLGGGLESFGESQSVEEMRYKMQYLAMKKAGLPSMRNPNDPNRALRYGVHPDNL